MPAEIERIDIWMGNIEDRPGGLAERLAALAEAGADLRFAMARRSDPGAGVYFVDPIAGAAQARAARKAGLEKSKDLQGLRVTAANKAGSTARLTRILADEGVNLRGLAGMALGSRSVFYLLLDSKDDAKKAEKALKAAKF